LTRLISQHFHRLPPIIGHARAPAAPNLKPGRIGISYR
jgi:hypothetical protein